MRRNEQAYGSFFVFLSQLPKQDHKFVKHGEWNRFPRKAIRNTARKPILCTRLRYNLQNAVGVQ